METTEQVLDEPLMKYVETGVALAIISIGGAVFAYIYTPVGLVSVTEILVSILSTIVLAVAYMGLVSTSVQQAGFDHRQTEILEYQHQVQKHQQEPNFSVEDITVGDSGRLEMTLRNTGPGYALNATLTFTAKSEGTGDDPKWEIVPEQATGTESASPVPGNIPPDGESKSWAFDLPEGEIQREIGGDENSRIDFTIEMFAENIGGDRGSGFFKSAYYDPNEHTSIADAASFT